MPTILPPPPSPPSLSFPTSASSSSDLNLVTDVLVDWQVVLRNERKVVLYNAESNALRVTALGGRWRGSGHSGEEEDYDGEPPAFAEEELEVISQADDESTPRPSPPLDLCPLCLRTLPKNHRKQSSPQPRRLPISKNASYFNLLSEANSRTNSPRTTRTTPTPSTSGTPLDKATLNSGYFASFFIKVKQLGRGGNGVVELVQHVLNGEKLGLYACKKIAVGDSSPTLLRILREVHLLEALQHPNIINYHHAWMESTQLTSFGPPVPTLHVLMAYANGGSLSEFVSRRKGGVEDDPNAPGLSKAERVRAFKMRKQGVVHLLRLDEIISIFEDVCEGLAFLHNRNILHLDLKAENVLLHWDDPDDLVPCAKLSDFGSSDFTHDTSRHERIGASGTLDWTPPELFETSSMSGKKIAPDRSTDQWALGLILHLLCYFNLPYQNDVDIVALESEIRAYPGFFPADAQSLNHGIRHDLPGGLLRIMALLIHRNPQKRPSCEEILVLLRRVKVESLSPSASLPPEASALVKQRSPSPSAAAPLPSQARRLPLPLPAAKTPLLSSALPPSRLRLPATRLRLSRAHQNRVLAALLALLKAVSLQHACRHTALSSVGMYALLLPTLIDFGASDLRVSLLLMGLHVLGMVVGRRGAVCSLRIGD